MGEFSIPVVFPDFLAVFLSRHQSAIAPINEQTVGRPRPICQANLIPTGFDEPVHPKCCSALDGTYWTDRQRGESGRAIVCISQDLEHWRNATLKAQRPELAVLIGADAVPNGIRKTDTQ